jgi:hypothetical protein
VVGVAEADLRLPAARHGQARISSRPSTTPGSPHTPIATWPPGWQTRGVAEHEAVRGSGRGEVFEAIVLLDRGERAGALLRGDADGVLGTAAAFGQAGYPCQQARTLALGGAAPGANW